MIPKTKLLAIVGSQRKNGNSYLLIKTILESMNVDYDIIQLVDKKLEFCNLCEKCVDDDCVLEDDFNQILEKMKKADGIIFAVPKYLFLATKFICFLERLDTISHMRKHIGYSITAKNPDYRLFSENKPFCLFALSGTGNIEVETLKITVNYVEFLGLKLVPNNSPPFVAISIKSGDKIGDVLENKEGMNKCKKMVKKLIATIEK